MQRGEVWDVDFPPPVADGDREMAGPHPALVMSARDYGQNPMVVVVPFTSKMQALRFPYTLLVQPTPQNGLTMPSVLLIMQLRAVMKVRAKALMGRMETETMREADRLTREMLGL